MFRFFFRIILLKKLASLDIIDLKVYNFPIFKGTLKTINNPVENIQEFANKIKSSDGIIIVTPKYNGGYPASLKNAISLLYKKY